MYTVDLPRRVRLACHLENLSQREAAERFGISRETVRKMLAHSVCEENLTFKNRYS